MLRATTIIRQAEVQAERVVDTLTLDHAARHRRRVVLKGDRGLEVLLDLDRAVVLGDGDALQLPDGRLLQVRAAGEKLVEITASTPQRLMQIAWHIGNRHTPAEIGEAALFIQEDHVLIDMVKALGGQTRIVERPFLPERGAYERGGSVALSHSHGHPHDPHDPH
jgi:urease accessory protein